MQDLFTRGVTPDGKLRPSYEDAPELYKESELGWIPKEWEVVRLGDVCKVRQGLQIAISNRHKDYGANRYPYITIQYLNHQDDDLYLEYIEKPLPNVICHKDDILMTRTGNTGMVITDTHGVFHNNFFLVDYNRENVDKLFMVHWLQDDYAQNYIMATAGITTIPDLKYKDFYNILFPLPSIVEQRDISDRIRQTEVQIRSEKGTVSVRHGFRKARFP